MRKYIAALFFGFGVAVVLVLVPSAINPLGKVFGGFHQYVLKILPAFGANSIFLGMAPIVLYALILFPIYLLTPWFRGEIKGAINKKKFLFYSIILYFCGTMVVYFGLLGFILFATSQWRPAF